MKWTWIMPNFDEKTGIRYGVISPNAVGQNSEYDLYEGPNCTDPQYEGARNEIIRVLDTVFEIACIYSEEKQVAIRDEILECFSDHYDGSSDGQMDYSDDEYDLHVSGDNFGIFVMRSPYYTYCGNCSLCAPGAGDLDNPIDKDTGSFPADPYLYRALCLGPEWFDEDNDQYARKIPYRVFRVDNDEEVGKNEKTGET